MAQTSVSTAAELAQRTTDQVTEVFGAARQRTQDLTERATQNLQAVTQSSAILARGIQEASGECLEMVQERVQKNLDGVNALVRCRTLPEFLAAQSSLFRDNLELTPHQQPPDSGVLRPGRRELRPGPSRLRPSGVPLAPRSPA